MILYTLVAAITIVLAYQIKTSEYSGRICAGYMSRQRMVNAISLAAIFTILASLAALRLEVGNDYGTYVVTCHEIFQRGYVVTEPGYNLVVRILYTLSGKEDYLLMFAVFGAAIVAVFLKAFMDQSEDFALTFFLFMTLGIYFRSFNTVRYYFALALAIYSLKFVIKINTENLIKFLIVIGFAATFHKSVLVVIPMYLLARLKWNKYLIALMCVAGVAGFLLSDKLINILLTLYPSYKDTVYLEQSRSIIDNLPIVARCIMVLTLCIICYKDAIKDNIANRTFFNLNIMGIILYLTCYWIPLVTRLGYYVITAHVLLVPGILIAVKNEKKRKLLKLAVIAFGVLYFAYFLKTAHNDGVRVLPYKSWLFYETEWLDQTDIF